ncbi:hypothetical protein AB1Y20_020158 [Prymnesium parvum]|uniref:DUF659 domain-containing protein n=1 Tax=Prymnesium parvum TaxID=97485 RepID=A0AB34JWE9_PRYPA
MLAQDATDLTGEEGDASGVIGEQTVPTPMPTVTADAHLGEQHLLWANDEQRQQLREQCIHKAGDITKTGQAFLFFVNPMYKAVGSQQLSASCVFCSRTVISTGSTRLVDHLLKCALVTNEVRKGFNQLRVESSKKRKMKDEESVLIHEQAQLAKLEHDNRQQQLKQQCIHASLKTSEIAAADMAIADFFYMNGLSFSAADPSPGSVYQKMVEAIKHTPSGYVPPNHHKLGGPLLDDCYSRMWKDIAARDPDGKNKKAYGCTYVSDGWDSIDSLPLVNSAFITAGDGGVYWRSVDTSGKTKDADYLASLMISDIYDFGCMNVVSVVTDCRGYL